jgi:hypothetical protein
MCIIVGNNDTKEDHFKNPAPSNIQSGINPANNEYKKGAGQEE